MGQILHGSATTTHAVRAAIQRSKASIQELSERHGVRHYYYESRDRSREHLATFLDTYNYTKRLKTLNGLTAFGTSAGPGQNKRKNSG